MEKNPTTKGDGEAKGDFESLGEVAARIAGHLIARAGKRHACKPLVTAANDDSGPGCASEIERRFPWGE